MFIQVYIDLRVSERISIKLFDIDFDEYQIRTNQGKWNKKILLATVFGLANMAHASAEASATPAKGFFLGVQTGVAATIGKYNMTSSNTLPTSNTVTGPVNANAQFGAAGGLFGIMSGYNFQKRNFVGGLELSGGFDSTKKTVWDNTASDIKDATGYYAKVNVKRSAFFEITPRLGFMVNAGTALLVKLGFQYSKWQGQVVADVAWKNYGTHFAGGGAPQYVATSYTQNKNAFSFAPGAALEVYRGKVLFRVEYSYLMQAKIKGIADDMSNVNNTSFNDSAAINSLNLSQHQVKVGLVYKF